MEGGGLRQFSQTELQAAQAALANDPNLRAQLLARQQNLNAQRPNLTPEQLVQLANLRANPEAAAQLAAAVRPQGTPQNQAFNQQRIQLLLQQQQQQSNLLQQVQALQGAPAAQNAAAAAAQDAGDAPGQSPARKRKVSPDCKKHGHGLFLTAVIFRLPTQGK